MAENKTDKWKDFRWPVVRVSLIPFTGGIICFVYAFFWPEGYGHWLGSIVRAFRNTAGF